MQILKPLSPCPWPTLSFAHLTHDRYKHMLAACGRPLEMAQGPASPPPPPKGGSDWIVSFLGEGRRKGARTLSAIPYGQDCWLTPGAVTPFCRHPVLLLYMGDGETEALPSAVCSLAGKAPKCETDPPAWWRGIWGD